MYNFQNDYQLKKSQDNFRFIVVSNTHYYKNPFKLCEAIVVYKKKYGNINFSIDWYGNISTIKRDMDLLNNGIELLKEEGLEGIIHFRGVIKDIYSKIKDADVLVHLSEFEGCPNSVCEAMFLKKPLLLSNVCDHPYLTSNRNGYLFNQTNPEDIAEKMYTMVNMKNCDLIAMGDLSKELIEDLMDRKMIINKWRQLIEKTVK